MDPQQFTTMANKFQSVLDEEVLNERGKHLGFATRERLITPFRLSLSVIASMATQHVQTIADLHRQFNELWALDTDYNAFYKQLLKSTAPEFFLHSLSHIMSQLTMKVLGFEAGKAFSEFNRLLLQDGSSFALHKALADVFPGRFNAVSPAAVELHCTMDLLQDAPIISQCPKRQRAELEAEWLIAGEPFRARLIVSWNPQTKCFDYLLTNLPKDRYTIRMICLGYKLRWQVELLFKEWKSYTNLHKFDTAKETISEALIWDSLTASAIKRFLAHAAEHLLEVVISTRKASMPSAYDLPALFRALRHGDGPWYRRAFKAMIHYLGRNAKRAHPERDARTGRSRLGLKPLFQLSEQQTLTDNNAQPTAA